MVGQQDPYGSFSQQRGASQLYSSASPSPFLHSSLRSSQNGAVQPPPVYYGASPLGQVSMGFHEPTHHTSQKRAPVQSSGYAQLVSNMEALHVTPRGATGWRQFQGMNAVAPAPFMRPVHADMQRIPPGHVTDMHPPPVIMGSHAHPAVAPQQIASRHPPAASQLPQCQWAYTVRTEELKFHRLQDLSFLDNHYLESNFQTQRLGFRFSQALDPTRTAQSLKLAIEAYPVVGSKVVVEGGKTKFHYDMENVTVQLVHVEAELMDSLPHLEQLCDILSPRSPDQKQNPLFSAFLFKTTDARDGSALVCGFQHTAGDARSYAMFMRKWSEAYEQLAAANQEPDTRMPPEVFAQYSLLKRRYQRASDGAVYRHFSMSDQTLREVKRAAMQGSSEALSTNDILCAQCAVALAPFRFQQRGERDVSSLVRIFMLVDTRGRSAPDGVWGNFVGDVAVDLAWSELLQGTAGSVLRVARRIRAALQEQTALMATDFEAFKAQRLSRGEIRKLFCWNSWARVGDDLRGVQFHAGRPPAPALISDPSDSDSPSSSASSSPCSSISQPLADAPGNLVELRWFNASWFPDPETVVVEPAACLRPEEGDARLVVHVASAAQSAAMELEALNRWWAGARVRED